MGEKASLKWQELSGSDDWSRLLEPELNKELREYIIQYGEKGQSIGDAFNNEAVSPAQGFSRCAMEDFFKYVGLDVNHPVKYDVTQFIYAREQVNIFLNEVNWIAYVAVSTDEGTELLGRRDILVVWRPTSTGIEWLVNANKDLVSAFDIFGENVMVHKGWHGVYTAKDDDNLIERKEYVKLSARDQVLSEVDKQIKAYEGDQKYEISITVVGHSMGGALATLNAMDIVANDHNLYLPPPKPDLPADQKVACQVTVFAFASPMVGDQGFKDLFDTLNKDKNLHALRIFNDIDVVPGLPTVGYVHVGEQLVVDCRKSPYLKSIADLKLGYLQLAHQLEPLLHVVAGWKGPDLPFDLNVNLNRDISLVNKDMDALNLLAEELIKRVPASWWVVLKKGMVQQEDGSWALEDYVPPAPQF